MFRLTRVTRRRRAVYPASVVGQPPQEDRYIGEALQEILSPLARMAHPEVRGLWAFHEAGFHNLLAVSVHERYTKEAQKSAFGLLGTGQVSLSKVVITVGPEVDPRDPEAVLAAAGAHFAPEEDFTLLPGTAMDTLDFTSFRLNLGSKMILDATPKTNRAPRAPLRPEEIPDLARFHPAVSGHRLVAGALLAVQVRGATPAPGGPDQDAMPDAGRATGPGQEVLDRLLSARAAAACPPLERVPLLAVVSDDVRLQDRRHLLWGIFTRFDAARDIRFRESRLAGAAPVYRGTLGIDATWKPGYPHPVQSSEETRRLVDRRWPEYGWSREVRRS